MKVAVIHDYLTQQGGAERTVLAMVRALGNVPVYTSLYDPDSTFPEFRGIEVHVSPLNRVPLLRRSHRLALPLLAPVFSRMGVDADVAICSSSGWAHGAHVEGRKIVYCHAPARWLYQTDRYAARWSPARVALEALRPSLTRWDRAAAGSADRYLVNSRAVGEQVRRLYGIDAELLHPPPGLTPSGEQDPIEDVEPGFVLCVSRLQRYKNVGPVVAAMQTLPDVRLLVAGEGPDRSELEESAPPNVRFLGPVTDARLRFLYAACAGVVSASFEDLGLVPLEAASFGRPAAVLRFGGFLDTVAENETGVFFDRPDPRAIAAAVERLLSSSWKETRSQEQAARFAEPAFAARLRELVREISGETA